MASRAILICLACLIFFARGDSAEIRVTTADAMKAAVASPPPEYAPLAKKANISGDVIVEININEQGDVTYVHSISGNLLLANPVLKTLKLWKFKPFQVEGKPTAAVTNLRFAFRN
jgi:periplasmic protein TonB